MRRKAVARIVEAKCIGCTRCIAACPVDAIVGAQALMHTVVEPWCIGCDLCLPACPVDCIELVPAQPWSEEAQRGVKRRALARKARLASAARRARPADPKALIAAALVRRKRA
ncbi:MAG: RnfABCDGE type electron transport complex subunit B [Clostridia bacterium]